MSTKRRVSTDGQGAAKKMKQQSHAVADALKDAALPDEAKAMLVGAVTHCLSVYADQRHPYQARIVEMAGETLGAIESGLVDAVTAAKSKVDSFDQRSMEMAIPQAAFRLAALKGPAAVKEAEIVGAKMELQQASDALKAVSKQQKAGDADYNNVASEIESLKLLTSTFEKMKEEVPSKRALTKLSNELKSLGVEDLLAESLKEVLTKPSSERGDFDNTTVGQVNEKLAEKSKEMEASLAPLEPGKTEREAAVTAATATHDAAKAKLDGAKAASKEAEKAVKDGQEAFEAAEDNLKNFAGNLKDAQDKLKEAESYLADFRSGPLESFKTLESCSTPAPEPEVAPEAAPEGTGE